MAATLKHYEVEWADGRSTTVKLNEEDVKAYKEAGAKVRPASKLEAPIGRAGMTKEQADAERAKAEASSDAGSVKAAQPANKAAAPDDK